MDDVSGYEYKSVVSRGESVALALLMAAQHLRREAACGWEPIGTHLVPDPDLSEMRIILCLRRRRPGAHGAEAAEDHRFD